MSSELARAVFTPNNSFNIFIFGKLDVVAAAVGVVAKALLEGVCGFLKLLFISDTAAFATLVALSLAVAALKVSQTTTPPNADSSPTLHF